MTTGGGSVNSRIHTPIAALVCLLVSCTLTAQQQPPPVRPGESHPSTTQTLPSAPAPAPPQAVNAPKDSKSTAQSPTAEQNSPTPKAQAPAEPSKSEPAEDTEEPDVDQPTGGAQVMAPVPPPESSVQQTAKGWAGNIYNQIVSAGIDPAHVYHIRDAYIDREDIHLTLDEGVIGFTRAIDGRITGAFFEGDGEVLLIPPDRVERWSMGQFIGAAILEERFTAAFLRFNDDVFEELQQYLRPAEDAPAFVARWDSAARSLAHLLAPRLLTTFVDSARPKADGGIEFMRDPKDRMFLLRVVGKRLGVFDVYYDSNAPEQINVGALALRAGIWYYDIWSSFPARSVRREAAEMKGRRTRSATLATQTGAEAFPPDPVRVTQYKLASDVRPPNRLEVDATMDVNVSEGGHRLLMFELSRYLKVTQVEADDKPVEFIQNQALQGSALARQGNDMVAIVLPQALEAGGHVRVRLKYAGEVLADAGGGLLYVGARGSWYPNRGPAMSNFDLTFRYPADWTLLATGKRTGDIEKVAHHSSSGEGAQASAPGPQNMLSSHWVSERPIPFAGFNLGQYVKATAKTGDVVVESYAAHQMENAFRRRQTVLVLPSIRPEVQGREAVVISDAPSPSANAQMVADQGARSIDFLSKRLGPYPYSSLAMTQMPGSISQGWPGLIFLSSYVYLSAEERAALRLPPAASLTVGRVMTPHEIGHEWWGDLLVWKSYREQWLVEALSNYCAMTMLESEDQGEFRTMMDFYRDQLLARNRDGKQVAEAGPVTLGVRLISANFPDAYDKISYGRGTWLFHMLREMLLNPGPVKAAQGGTGHSPVATQAVTRGGPDEPFFRVLRKVREKFEGKEITTRDLQLAFEEELPPQLWYEGRKSLDWFFDTWVNGMSVPNFELSDLHFSSKTGTLSASGKITQKDSAQGLVTNLPLYAVTPTATTLIGRVWVEGPETTFRFAIPEGTKKISLDPYQTVLRRSTE